MQNNLKAEAGQIFVCRKCGKLSTYKFGVDEVGNKADAKDKSYASQGWDKTCIANSCLYDISDLEFDKSAKAHLRTGAIPINGEAELVKEPSSIDQFIEDAKSNKYVAMVAKLGKQEVMSQGRRMIRKGFASIIKSVIKGGKK